jgi:hypothetical protein
MTLASLLPFLYGRLKRALPDSPFTLPMSSNRRFPFVAGLLVSLLLACGGQAEPAPAPDLDTLMSQLGDASFTVRDRAAARGLLERAWEAREQVLAGGS